MKNTFVGLIAGIIITMWVFYFIRLNPLKFINNDNKVIIPTPEPQISIYPSITLAPTEFTLSDLKDDTEIVKELLANKYHKKVTDIELNITEYDGTHIWGSFTFKLAMEGGYVLAAKNSEQQWVIVQDGNGTISCELVAPYNFPSSMVPECVNNKGKLIKL